MRMYLFIISIMICAVFNPLEKQAESTTEEITYILEVNESTDQVVSYIKRHYPRITIEETYEILINAVAVKGLEKEIAKLQKEPFVQVASENIEYEAISNSVNILEGSQADNMYIPNELNDTRYTGKGVKVGVIDTGIDMDHEDLQGNFKGGTDVVDYKEEPRETDEGFGQTMHGTHVAGIIAANGTLKGVAPESSIYAYRALGRGGQGTSVQVIAAMEEAVQDNVDIINLSLGNMVNVPDYPTSKAVNEAIKLGIIVVVANGNDGPEQWTVGAPATASKALSVGAYAHEMEQPYIQDRFTEERFNLAPITGYDFWLKETSHYISLEESRSHILYVDDWQKENDKTLEEKAKHAQAILLNEKTTEELDEQLINNLPVPVAIVEEDFEQYILEEADKHLIDLQHETTTESVAPFSSRGPVAMNWQMKPDIIAPGVNVISTIPDGYEALNGTSMASPHIAGAVAVMKEARPTWSNEQIIGALKTTAKNLHTENTEVKAYEQGTGLVQLNKAIHTNVIIDDPLLSFGKLNRFIEERTIKVMIENIGREVEEFTFDIPKKETGITWQLPQSFTIEPNERKEIEITLKINTSQMDEGIHEGALKLKTENEMFTLPYLYVYKNASNKKIDNFTIQLESSANDEYDYMFYATEKVKQLDIELLDVENMIVEQNILTLKNVHIGKNIGKIKLNNINVTNQYVFVLTIQLDDGRIIHEYVDL